MGLIGGSVALSLKKAGTLDNTATQIVGVGRGLNGLQMAKSMGVIDSIADYTETSLKAACAQADVILIAAPVAQTASILQSIQPHLQPQTVITDAGSTKGDVLAVAHEILGAKVNQFVGGHPIAGAEKSGVTAANAELFSGKNVVLTPTAETNPDAVKMVRQLWQTCGANVAEMSAETHDQIFSAVSHLPHLLAFALVNEIANRSNAAQLLSFAASGFRDFTRIAGSSPEMWRDISLANKTALLQDLMLFESQISHLKQLLANNDGVGLQALFETASMTRNDWAKTK